MITKYTLRRTDNNTFRSNIRVSMIQDPTYTNVLQNAVILSRRAAAEQRLSNERMVPIHVSVAL